MRLTTIALVTGWYYEVLCHFSHQSDQPKRTVSDEAERHISLFPSIIILKHYIYHFKNGSWKKELIKIETEFYRIFVKLNFKAFCILESDTMGTLDIFWLNFQVDNLHKIS